MFSFREIIILTFLIVFCLLGSSAATKEISHIDITINTAKSNLNYGLNIPKYVNITKTTPAKFNIKKVNVTINNRQVNESGCCSVLVHIKSGYDIFSFRRDSTYAANLYFKRFKWYGKDTIKEYKINKGYFFHTIITKDGWIISSGGSDVPNLNRELENLAGKTTVSGHITSTTINNALNVLKRLGMGHFLIKAPNDYVGLVIYNGGNTKKAIFKMANGQYVSVPNHPSYYRNGYTSTSNPIYSAIHLATTDKWGVNRRNIITYEVMKYKDISKYSTLVNIYASTCRGTPDNIIFGGKTIGKYTIPKIPNKKYIGQVKLKNINPMGNFRYTVLNGRVSSNPISNSFKQKYNTPIVSYPPLTSSYNIKNIIGSKTRSIHVYQYINDTRKEKINL